MQALENNICKSFPWSKHNLIPMPNIDSFPWSKHNLIPMPNMNSFPCQTWTQSHGLIPLLCTWSLEGGGEGDDCVHMRVVEIWQSEECLGYHPSLCGGEGGEKRKEEGG